MRAWYAVLGVLLMASPAFAQAATETFTVNAPTGVTACEIERSTDNGTTWAVQPPQLVPAGTPRICTFGPFTPPTGRMLYRWAQVYGTTRILRTDAGHYTCVGLTDCPFVSSPSNMVVQ